MGPGLSLGFIPLIVTRLVWYDETDDVTAAIELEKCLKGWLRKKKVALIEENNPNWLDLAAEWYE
ncbi:MAG: hypothetical protein ISR95_09460 [Candidatus Marinimicrobia bacterium]|nr:hypothetical protein [Candidatus Neomarinimicrobiota bacterium]